MARPERHDVEYFPFLVKQGKTLTVLHNKYGLEGIGFFTNVMRFFAITPDHHYCIKNESDMMHFISVVGINDDAKAIDMIELMVKTEKLDKELWENHKVIVCPAFIESIKDAYKRRANDIITVEEIRAKYQGSGVIVAKNDTETPQGVNSDDNNPQKRKEKKRKEKSKEEKRKKELSPEMRDALILSELLLTSHRKEIPDYLSGKDDEQTINSWAQDIEKIIRLDKKSPDVIRQVILWAKTPGCFWFPNIQSGSKLRKQFETLYSQMITDNKKNGKGSQPFKIGADKAAAENVDKYFK